jgi:hypothetical protein
LSVEWCDVAQVTINMLPDFALIEIFDFYLYEEQTEAWHTLVHVSQRWRTVVFGSPRRLGLHLSCTASTRVMEMLDVWPPLPIVVCDDGHEKWGVDNIVAALEHNDRICQLEFFDIPSSQMEKVLPEMQQSFPALTYLWLWFEETPSPVDSMLFLGGSAPRLQTLILDCVPFLELPKLLLSATHLVHLQLRRIPNTGRFSPEAMATCLSVLTRLERLVIRFKYSRFHPDWKSKHPPLQTRILLPVLTELRFYGEGGYLEDLVAQIDAPILDMLDIAFHLWIYDIPQLTQFISRAPKFKAHDEARLIVSDWDFSAIFPRISDDALELAIACKQPNWYLSSLVEGGSVVFPRSLIPTVKHLYILEGTLSRTYWQDNEGSEWLEILRPFTAVKTLYISRRFVPHIVPALQGVTGERVTEVLPALQTLFLEEPIPSGPVQEAVEQFVAARQLSSHPIVVSHWERIGL